MQHPLPTSPCPMPLPLCLFLPPPAVLPDCPTLEIFSLLFCSWSRVTAANAARPRVWLRLRLPLPLWLRLGCAAPPQGSCLRHRGLGAARFIMAARVCRSPRCRRRLRRLIRRRWSFDFAAQHFPGPGKQTVVFSSTATPPRLWMLYRFLCGACFVANIFRLSVATERAKFAH